MQTTLFEPIVPLEKLDPTFKKLRESPGLAPARWMLDDVYQEFDDRDGNFLEQFQTTGFNARFFELYLFAYLSRSGFKVERQHPHPDFLVSRDGISVAVEATTTNPSTSGILAKIGKKISDLSVEEIAEYLQNELPIRLAGPLTAKLERKYWELDHCRELPFVIAIEAFHDNESLVFSDHALARYLFGLQQTGSWEASGRLKVNVTAAGDHTVGEKVVPSTFFAQRGAEHVSAVLFTNGGTATKFARMGYQHGIGCDVIEMIRTGFAFDPDPNAMDAAFFSYNLDTPPIVENWGQGLVILHNPTCLHPLPKDFFYEAVQTYVESGFVKSDHPAWTPFSSKTEIVYLGEIKRKLLQIRPSFMGSLSIGSITKASFQHACGFAITDSNPLVEEHGWFSDESDAFLGVVVRDKVDKDWGYVVLARDARGQFRGIESESSLASRERARMELQLRIAGLCRAPQRFFPQ